MNRVFKNNTFIKRPSWRRFVLDFEVHFSVFILPVRISIPFYCRILISPLTGTFTSFTLPRPYRIITCRERELAVDHIRTLLTTQGHGVPPQMNDQLNAEATSETPRTLKTMYIIYSYIHFK